MAETLESGVCDALNDLRAKRIFGMVGRMGFDLFVDRRYGLSKALYSAPYGTEVEMRERAIPPGYVIVAVPRDPSRTLDAYCGPEPDTAFRRDVLAALQLLPREIDGIKVTDITFYGSDRKKHVYLWGTSP